MPSKFDSFGGNPIKCWGCNSSVEGLHGEVCGLHDAHKTMTNSIPQPGFGTYTVGPAIGCGAYVGATIAKPLLPADAKERKKIPLWTGLVKYFPLALIEVAKLSHDANEQHNPGQPVHWAREKSTDQEDTLLRHLFESGEVDVDGHRHSTKVAWRALAKLQLELEAAQG